jgi:hypothetical protein
MNQSPPAETEQRAPSAEEFRALVTAVRRFILAHRHRLPDANRDPGRWLTEFIVFHAVRGTLAVVWSGGIISGVAIAWQAHTRDLLAAVRANRDVFDWTPSDPAGDCVYLALALGERNTCRLAAKYFLEFHPNWRELKQFAHRKGRFVNARQTLQKLAAS